MQDVPFDPSGAFEKLPLEAIDVRHPNELLSGVLVVETAGSEEVFVAVLAPAAHVLTLDVRMQGDAEVPAVARLNATAERPGVDAPAQLFLLGVLERTNVPGRRSGGVGAFAKREQHRQVPFG